MCWIRELYAHMAQKIILAMTTNVVSLALQKALGEFCDCFFKFPHWDRPKTGLPALVDARMFTWNQFQRRRD